MVPWADWRPWMLRWEEPWGPFISKSAAVYTGDMNRLLADQMVRGAVCSCVQRTQAAAMVKSTRWANVLVRHDAKLHMALALQVGTFFIYVTGLLKVMQSMLFRGIASVEDNGFLYDPYVCVRGLVDTWTSVTRYMSL